MNSLPTTTIIHIRFVSPEGVTLIDPDPGRISSLLLHADAEYWESGTGDAGIRFEEGGVVKGELIIMIREPHGVFVLFTDPVTSDEYALSNKSSDDDMISVQQGGEPWELPRKYFVSRSMANEAVSRFMDSGKRTMEMDWESF